MPTLTASAPASIRASVASAVAMLPATTWTSKRSLICRTVSTTALEWPCDVSTTSTSTSSSTRAAARSSASCADADGGGDAEPPLLVLRGERELDPLLDVLDGDQALEVAGGVDDGELLDPVPAEDLPRVVERRPDRNGDQLSLVIRFAIGCCDVVSKRRSRFVRMPTSRPVSSVIGTPEMW